MSCFCMSSAFFVSCRLTAKLPPPATRCGISRDQRQYTGPRTVLTNLPQTSTAHELTGDTATEHHPTLGGLHLSWECI